MLHRITQFATRVRSARWSRDSLVEELPLRAELFSADQLERYGRTLAAAHRLSPRRAQDQLLPRLAANENTLVAVCKRLIAAVSAQRRISPAGEWLLDNFHLIEEQIGIAKRHLPRGYSRELPRLALAPSAGVPRVYDIALKVISHGDGRFDAESLRRFVAAYQSVTTLTLGELWAIPIMLRLALIENLRRVGVRISASLVERDLANAWADRMMETAQSDPKSLILVVADMARSNPPMGSAFVAELARRLQGRSAALALALTWIEQRLAESHLTIEQSIQSETQKQASGQVSISNSIGSLRFLSAIDWRDFVEATSVVETAFRSDPAGVYSAMDFATRDRYRHVAERLARACELSEAEVAAHAITLARQSALLEPEDDRRAHVGFYLIDDGLPKLERAIGAPASRAHSWRLTGARAPQGWYFGAIASITAILTAGLVANAAAVEIHGALLVLVVALSLLAASQVAVTLANWVATLMIAPHTLPRMDFSAGIAPTSRTLVAVPAMLTSTSNVDALVEALEVRFLANRDARLHFALLTDFTDARQETMPGDAALLEAAKARIDELNQKYGRMADLAPRDFSTHDDAGDFAARAAADGPPDAADGSIFYLLHRPRLWNGSSSLWMGHERKRGKLADLNALLRDAGTDSFSFVVGDVRALAEVKYVITLDTDTQLPRDAAREFVGTMAHPLNKPRFEERGPWSREVVTAGYGILQPRVSVSLPGANRSRYARLYGGEPGIDPYTRTVSDVYQDLFAEGSFIGKGIYDVDAFERAMKGRFPDNTILSHDLLEGCYARAGLLSDLELYEGTPARFSADVARRRRWIRGDWQLAGWLRRRVKGRDGRRERNPLSMLSQWKIFDNLRRSLVPPALTSLLLLGWSGLAPVWFWTAIPVGILLLPSAISLLSGLIAKPRYVSVRQHLDDLEHAALRHIEQWLFALAVLPFEAYYSLDSIVRTIARMLFTRRNLLEWTPSSEVERGLDQRDRSGLVASYRTMVVAPALAAATWTTLAIVNPPALGVAVPILVLWASAPALAWWLSRRLVRRNAILDEDQARFVRKLARRTWAYFETYVGPDDHWLPPDNVQEHPARKVAHRTSPTNMGLALLADLTAHDFGYLSTGQLVVRTTNALRTMESLERYRGHFYNWYDTQTRLPLAPHYISTVDSGNLAGHLMTLRPGLVALGDAPILSRRWREGLADTFSILLDAAGTDPPASLRAFQAALVEAAATRVVTLEVAWKALQLLTARAIDATAHFAAEGNDDDAGERRFWAAALARQCTDLLEELALLAPWLETKLTASIAPVFQGVDGIPTLRELAALAAGVPGASGAREAGFSIDAKADTDVLSLLIQQGAERAADTLRASDELALDATALSEMDYDFLFDPVRRQLVIGYNVADGRRDESCYDLLASEARLSVFVAIAQGKLPQESWFALGRLLASVDGEPVLMAWGGSMFEYLMPLLVMPTYENTLLDQTYLAAVDRQIAYGRQRGVPWGMSESGYNTVDGHLSYQYRAFGVPGLGLKRGLGDDLVVAPYATALALMVEPEAACLNLQRLAGDGMAGTMGFFEAIDYTPSRQRRGESSAIVRSYMAHHQGMSLLACAYVLLARPMQKRFAADPLLRATLLLLQERIPRATTFHSEATELPALRVSDGAEQSVRVLANPDSAVPEVQLLSNGRYHVMVNHAGGGSSRWKDIAVTRWREDATADHWGTFCYLRDEATGEFWSTARQPTANPAKHYEAIFTEGRAEFRRRDFDFETHLEIVVSPEDDIEIRRLRVTNRSRAARTIEVTSYAEIVLAPPAADALHPAFSNLFVQTELLRERNAILCTRRPRSPAEDVPWMFHSMLARGSATPAISYETDRMRFIGRGGSVAEPRAMTVPGPLSDTVGSVLDPVASIRLRLVIAAGTTTTIDMVTGAAATRDEVARLVDKYQDRGFADRVFELTWTHSQVLLRQLNATEADAQLYSRLASSVIYANASLRAAASVLVSNRRRQSGLWGYAISGDLPIVLLQIASVANFELARQLVQAHAYWRLKGLAVDLVIWNEDHDVYRQQLQDQIIGMIAGGVAAHVVDRPGGIFVRHAEQIAPEDRILFQAVARAIISDGHGTLAEQLNRVVTAAVRIPQLAPTRGYRPQPAPPVESPAPELLLANGIGGFAADGREYVIAPPAGRTTPAPWANVIANPQIGSVVTAGGLGYTWCENAHLFRLTPWHNDPVGEGSGEALYLRDEETGHFWSPTALPCGNGNPVVTRHGFGYTIYENVEDGIRTELATYVALDVAVKYFRLRITNESGRARRLSVTGYVEWVLGDVRAKSAMHVTTEIDPQHGALLARNPYHSEFSNWVAFFDADIPSRTVTGDRAEFIGRNGSMRDPAAMHRTRLSGKAGAALDPCAAIQVPVDLADAQGAEVVFRLGAAGNLHGARDLLQRARGAQAAQVAFDAGIAHWRHTLDAVQVETPDAALDVIANGWLVYQTMACRLWARSGFYQSGGAYGFRDQLQDAMALVHAQPGSLRAQIVLCASRQFTEGDVQHWWHPPTGRGVRTRCSDDYLWLPLATCRYVRATGDLTILDELAPFLEGRPVNADDDSYYDLPIRSDESATLYEHCMRALQHGLRFGAHGLPLMGSGDWNDGMNLVGIGGKGESVWLGFFLCHVLTEFEQVANLRDDPAFGERCAEEARELRERIEASAWDGGWYRRAYFDDGTPLGSAANAECQIDSIAQSWSVLSGAGDAVRTRTAMDAVHARLVRHDDQLIQLLDPPFDKSGLEPGYIRGYVPGVRENGGQYTHAAIWTAMAFAALGDHARAWEVAAMINPVNHARSSRDALKYKVEPYVVAADVYAVAPHTGRGGWTWYTGSAGWMYRLIIESLLGVTRDGDRLRVTPCMPADWTTFSIRYRFGETPYRIAVNRIPPGSGADAGASITVDGVAQVEDFVRLVDDRREHRVDVSVSA